ncbi:MAG: T9SS type A sorting domain-containing protein [Bacteroidia bacterium]
MEKKRMSIIEFAWKYKLQSNFKLGGLFLLLLLLSVNLASSQNNAREKEEDEGEVEQTSTSNCGGVERWSVKVLTDALASTVVFTPIPTSIAHLVAIVTPTPSSTMPRYQPVEDSTYIVTCNITIKKAESDSDYHLVLSNGSQTLIGEIPDPICSSVAASPYASQFQACRNFINAHIARGNVYSVSIPPVTVTGVAFVDPPHGQTGAAPNNLELHPILNIYFASTAEIEGYNLDNFISVSPNPSDGKIHIQSTKYLFQGMDVYNSLGEHIYKSTSPDVDLSSHTSGVYFIHIHTERGSAVKKIIINK